MDVDHQPDRPSWNCSTCSEEWPCPPAKVRLTEATGGGTALAITSWNYLEEFIRDQPTGPLAEVFDRFVRWTRPPV